MKKLLFTLALILGASTCAVASERTVSIYQFDGQVVTFSFQDCPVVTYSGNDLVLTTTKTTVQYPIYKLRKLVFDEDWDYITDNIADELEMEPDKATTKFGFQDGILTIVGVDPGSSVRLYNLKGMQIGVYRVGKFEGDQATGTFTLNTTNPFTESTVEQVVDLVNSGGSQSLSYKHLLSGTLQHKIDCQFTIIRNSESNEYTVNYTGSGDYTLNHEVVSRVEHMDFNNWPNGNQSITADDIFTQQKVADGTVKLQYSTKLK